MTPKDGINILCVCVCLRLCTDLEQAEIRDSGSLHEMEPACSSLPEMQKTVSDMGLWRMQLCAVAWLRFLKLKRGKKALSTLWVSEHWGLFVSECPERVKPGVNLKQEHNTHPILLPAEWMDKCSTGIPVVGIPTCMLVLNEPYSRVCLIGIVW